MNEQDGHRGAIVVTGVSTGIGRAIAEDLMDSGYRVFGSVRKSADAEALTAHHGRRFVPLVFDVTDAAALPDVVETVTRELRGTPLTALVNNAGISLSGPLMHQPMEEIRQTFEVNVFAALALTQAFLPLLGARADREHAPGRVVNISSVSGAVTVPFMGAYSASKHALEAFTQALRRELRIYGIEVVAIEPNFIRSRIFEKTAASQRANNYADTAYAALWAQFNHSLLSQESKAKPATVVTRAVLHAIEAPKPRTRYPLDALWHVGRYLPDRWFDRLIDKALGIERLMVRK